MVDRVAVVGGGISGLSAALAIVDADPAAEVTLYDDRDRLGGLIATGPFAGVDHVDEAADAFLARVPDAVELAQRVGLGDDLVSPEPVGAAVWYEGLHPIPDGLLLGLPGRIGPLATTKLLSWRGKARAALEPMLPRTSTEADSIGAFVRARFGNEVHERLVDALVGSIYAADTDNFSLAEVPQLAALATQHRSLLLAARRHRAGQGTATAAASPIFATPRKGMSALVDATADAVASKGGTLHTGAAVSTLTPAGDGRWTVTCDAIDRAGRRADFDAVVVATPAAAASRLLADAAPSAAALLARAERADVIMVTMHISADQWPGRLRGISGYLVPKPVQNWVTAASFASQKWAHWRPPAGGEIVRASLGRDGRSGMHLDDDTVVELVLTDLRRHLGVGFAPLEIRITRWPGAFAQYRPHHREWVAAVEEQLPAGVVVAGAGYRGIGIPACVRAGVLAADRSGLHRSHLEESHHDRA